MSSACHPATNGEDQHATNGEDQQTDAIQVMAEDIPQRVQILGDLGYPLFTVLKVEGTWEKPPADSKDAGIRFRVTHVNGLELKTSREFSQARMHSAPGESGTMPDPAPGDTWHITCVESGGMVGFPPHVWEEFGVREPMMPYNGRFMTQLYVPSDEVHVESATDRAQ